MKLGRVFAEWGACACAAGGGMSALLAVQSRIAVVASFVSAHLARQTSTAERLEPDCAFVFVRSARPPASSAGSWSPGSAPGSGAASTARGAARGPLARHDARGLAHALARLRGAHHCPRHHAAVRDGRGPHAAVGVPRRARRDAVHRRRGRVLRRGRVAPVRGRRAALLLPAMGLSAALAVHAAMRCASVEVRLARRVRRPPGSPSSDGGPAAWAVAVRRSRVRASSSASRGRWRAGPRWPSVRPAGREDMR